MTAGKNYVLRYLAVAAIFCLICVIYLGRLFYIQIAGKADQYETGTTTRTVTIRAVRGELYDRNGVPLVQNEYSYDLTLIHSSFSSLNNKQANETALFLLEECQKEDKHTEKYFPFDGQYPNYQFNGDVNSSDTLIYYRLKRVLGDIGLKSDASVEQIISHYVKTYDLLALDGNGSRLFDDGEVDRLIRLRYGIQDCRYNRYGAGWKPRRIPCRPLYRHRAQEVQNALPNNTAAASICRGNR